MKLLPGREVHYTIKKEIMSCLSKGNTVIIIDLEHEYSCFKKWNIVLY